MRDINDTEKIIIEALNERNSYIVNIKDDFRVYEINDGMGTIRPHYTKKHEIVYAVVQCEFLDEDGVVVAAILLLDKNNRFGELNFWRVDDKPIKRFPSSKKELRNFHHTKTGKPMS